MRSQIILSLDRTAVTRLREIGELPAAAIIGGRAVWFRDDIDLRARGKAVSQRIAGWMQDEVVGVAEVARRLKKKENTIISAINRESWTTIPEKDGKAADSWYWVRGPFRSLAAGARLPVTPDPDSPPIRLARKRLERAQSPLPAIRL